MKYKHNIVRVYAEYIAFKIAILLMRLLPKRGLYALAKCIAKLIYIFDTKHRRRIILHLLHAGVAKNEQEAKVLAWKNFVHITKIICDIGRASKVICRENLDSIIKLAPQEPWMSEFAFGKDSTGKARQMIVASAHFGNWEVAGNMYVWLANRPLVSVMRPLDNPHIGDYIYQSRQSDMHTICDKNGALKTLISALNRGDSICLITDQHAPKKEGVEVTFFGKPVCAHTSIAKLHMKTKIPIAMGSCRKVDDDDHFVFDIMDIIEYSPEATVESIMQRYMHALEKEIMLAPEQWIWAHRRFTDLRQLAHDKKLKY